MKITIFEVYVCEEASRRTAVANKAAAAAFHLDLRRKVFSSISGVGVGIVGGGKHHLRCGGVIVAVVPLQLLRGRLNKVIILRLSRRERRGAVHEPGEDDLRLRAGGSRVEELGEVFFSESAFRAQKASQIRARGRPVSGQPRAHLRVLLELIHQIQDSILEID